MYNVIYGKCPDYFNHNIRFVNDRHYTTWASTNIDLTFPFLTPRPANDHVLQVALNFGIIKTVLRRDPLIPL